MKHILTAFLFISIYATSFSQVTQINNLDDMYILKNDVDAKYNRQNDPNVKGSPFIHSDYQNIKIKGVAMKGKYNANLDYFEIENNGKIVFFGPTFEHRYEVVYTDSKTTYKAFEYKKLKLGFFKILARKDKSYLLSRQFIKYQAETKALDNFSRNKPAKFERKKDEFYIKLSSQDIVIKLPTRKSKFLKIFNSDELKKFIKKERLNIKKEDDLIKIFKFYNSL